MRHNRPFLAVIIAALLFLGLALAGCGGGAGGGSSDDGAAAGGGGNNGGTADATAPVITLTGDSQMTLDTGESFTDPGATAADDTDGDISGSVAVSGTVDTSTAGTYTLTYNVADAAGNAATAVTRTVIVQAAFGGAAMITGKISLSNLTAAESEALAEPTAARTAARAASRGANVRLYDGPVVDPTAGAAVMLYVIGEDGELESTGIRGSLVDNGDGTYSYEFDGVKGGINYIVRYLKKTADGNVFELKAQQYVPEEADDPTVPEEDRTVTGERIDKLSTALAEMIVEAVVTATEGTDIDEETVNKMIDSVYSVVEEFVQRIAPQRKWAWSRRTRS
jgi:hypothetical protein